MKLTMQLQVIYINQSSTHVTGLLPEFYDVNLVTIYLAIQHFTTRLLNLLACKQDKQETQSTFISNMGAGLQNLFSKICQLMKQVIHVLSATADDDDYDGEVDDNNHGDDGDYYDYDQYH